MLKRTIKSLMTSVLAIAMFASCGDGDISEGQVRYGFDIGTYDYGALHGWLGNATNASGFDFDTTLPPQGSVSSGSYDSSDNTFGDFSVASSTGNIQITNLNFQTENIIPDTYPSIIYASTVDAFIKKTIDGAITWDDATLKVDAADVIGYYILIYSTNDNWRTITPHKTAYINATKNSEYNTTYKVDNQPFENNVNIVASHLFVAAFAVVISNNIIYLNLNIIRKVLTEVHKDQGLLTNASRRDKYFADNGISGMAIRFFEIVDDSSFTW